MRPYLLQVLSERRGDRTLREFEDATGMDRGTLSRIERGQIDTIQTIELAVAGYAEVLGVPASTLYREALERLSSAEGNGVEAKRLRSLHRIHQTKQQARIQARRASPGAP